MSEPESCLSLTGRIEALIYAMALIGDRMTVEAPASIPILLRHLDALAAILASGTRQGQEREK